MIKVYVQLGLSCEVWTTFASWTDRERAACQRLSNRFKTEVRALKNDQVLAAFVPNRTECSEGCG